MFVTRVLGLTGYDAGHAWAIVTNANYDVSTITSGTPETFTADFSGNTEGVYNYDGTGGSQAQYLYNLFDCDILPELNFGVLKCLNKDVEVSTYYLTY